MIYIVRHGTTDYNLEGRLQGQLDIELNEQGVKDALETANILKAVNVDEIYTSDLKRAYKTAKIISLSHDTGGVINDRRLREIYLGKWQGKTYDFLRANDPDYCVFYDNPINYRGNVPEPYNEVVWRLNSFFNDVDETKDVVVVTHGFVIYTFLKENFGENVGGPIKNCEIIKYDKKTGEIVRNYLR